MIKLDMKQTSKLAATMQTEAGSDAMLAAVVKFVEIIDLLEDAAALIDADDPAPSIKSPYSMSEFVKVGGSI